MTARYDAENGAAGFAGTVEERKRLDRSVKEVSRDDKEKASSPQSQSGWMMWVMVAAVALGAIFCTMSGYNNSHDRVLTTPTAGESLDIQNQERNAQKAPSQ